MISVATRRRFLIGSGAALAAGGLLQAGAAGAAEGAKDLSGTFARIEAQSGGRLGVSALDTETGWRSGYRAVELFPMCSTFKLLAGAAVLARVDAGREKLDRRIRFEAADLVEYSPTTKGRVGGEGMTLAELCEAAITLSDNTAANLILASMDGPAGLTAFVRSMGDPVTRLDRNEPTLNQSTPGDPRDTTTPDAMTADLRALVLGDALSAASRDQLTAWLMANKTGDTRIRAGVPKGWQVGDKTGTGEFGSTNDAGVIWPPGRKPIILSVYLTTTKASTDERNAVIAEVARAVATTIAS